MPALLLLSVSLIWGFYYLGIDTLLDSGWQAHWMNAIRFLLGGAILTLLALARRQKRELIELHRRSFPKVLLVSWLAVGLATALLTLGQQFIASSVAGILGALIPVATVLLGALAGFGSQRISAAAWIGVLLGAFGVVLIASPWNGQINFFGVVAVIIAAFLFALEAQWIGKWFSEQKPLVLTAALTFWTGAGFTLLALPFPFQAGSWPLLLMLALASNVVGYSFFLLLIARSGPVFANLNNYLVPAVAVAAGVLIAREHMTWALLLGAILCIGGAALAGTRVSARPAPENMDPTTPG